MPAATHQRPAAADPSVFAHPGVDGPTLGLLAVMWAGLGANLAWGLATPDPAPWQLAAHVAVGVLFLNLSFTIWHEAAHGTVFRSRFANDVVGVLGAWPAWIPYFLIRRGHKLHHAHVNDPARDPDAWFNQGSIWTLPLRYPAGVRRTKAMVAATAPPAWEARADLALSLLLLGAMTAIAWFGGLWILLACWVVPKGVAMWIHAWYVNVLPHQGLSSERFRDTRIYTARWLAWPTVMHSYHGVHHAWQTVPWHRYRRLLAEKRAFLEERGAPIVDPARR